ncbi:AMP-dependent synthetase/ligase [Salinimicrobium xinjiangense]|uniref:AMP-dependent synthetase/ligase n=1 Tax=Salinimicrobium xinjiangense TaxID=438596 RepID=UPI00041ACAF9|nr:long-chain fatty acid--CoA ligase [Salinimicrobium xinjiangense]
MIEIKRLFDFPYFQLENAPLEKSLVTKRNGTWEALTTQEYIDKANAVSRGLLRLGIQPNDKIAVISTNNRTEWNVVDIGILQVGAQNVPIYPTVSEEDYEYVINHSESIYCFVSDKEILDKLNTIRGNTQLKGVYTFDEIAGADNWSEILKLGEDTSNQEEVEARKNAVKEDDLATLIYTSGTTGRPKGVMLSHKNIVSDVLLSSERVPFDFGSYVALSFLPVCHIFERMILYLYQYYSVSIHFAESIDMISDNLKEVKPHVISAVPRLLEKVYDKIIAKGSTVGGIKQKLFFWSVELGLKYEPYGANGWWYETQLSLARKLVFSKWKEGLGGRIELIVSGSAALQPRLARVFAAAGIPVMEGYGLTETSPVISVNDQRNGGFKIGTVGRVLKNVEVKIAEDGEILCKGPNVMQGYYKEPEKTKEVINGDGFFHTGDIGELDADGFLKITDRKKEMFKTSGGKYVAPQVIENQLKQSRFIAELMVIGEGEKMPAALIQPDFDFVREWAKRKHVEVGPSNADLINNEQVKARIQEEVDFYNQKFGSWEKIKKFELTPDVWSIEGEHLTPTMKLKRRNIIKLYQKLYDGIYEK